MESVNLILFLLTKIIKYIIFIIGKTIVFYIKFIKIIYFIIINHLFHPNYMLLSHLKAVATGWFIISIILKFFLVILFLYFVYHYFLLFKFLGYKVLYEFRLFKSEWKYFFSKYFKK